MVLRLLHLCMIMLAYLAAAGYVLYRLKQTFTNKGRWFKAACWLCAPMTVLFILVLFLRLFNLGSWFLPFQTVAYLWLTAVMYAALFAVAFDALRLLAYLIKPLRKRVLPFLNSARPYYALVSVLCVIGLLGYGLYHFTQPKVVDLTVEVDKPVPDLNIVVVSDLHLGTMSAERLLMHVDTINALQPDMVLMLGDQFVINWRDVVPMGYAKAFRKLRAPMGIYAVNGNHEGYHEFSRSTDPRVGQLYRYLRVNLLNDTAVVVDGKLALIGRADSSRLYARKSLPEIMENVPDGLPTILMDHQPADLGQAKACDVDLQLSGHMHNGQFFPMNLYQGFKSLFNKKLYYGYRQDGGTQYYVTAGLGSSGAPMRIGTDVEITVVHLKQKTHRESPVR